MGDYVIDGKTISRTFSSLLEVADVAASALARRGCIPLRANDEYEQRDFYGGPNWREAIELARHGWTEQLDKAMDIAESAVTLCRKEHDQFTFAPVYDLVGAEVDMALYYAGERECMLDYELSTTSRAGRVITLCVGLGMPGYVEAADALKRGYAVVALALALSRLGHSIEIWGDRSGEKNSWRRRERVLIKGVDDDLNPGVIMFALAHPAFVRACMMHGTQRDLPEVWFKRFQTDTVCGFTIDQLRDLPEGTIYVQPIKQSDTREPIDMLTDWLDELGLLAS